MVGFVGGLSCWLELDIKSVRLKFIDIRFLIIFENCFSIKYEIYKNQRIHTSNISCITSNIVFCRAWEFKSARYLTLFCIKQCLTLPKWIYFVFPQIPLRVPITTLLLDGFTIFLRSGCVLWSFYQSSPMVLSWWPQQSSRNSVTHWIGSWSISLLLILERQFLPAPSVSATSFLAISFWDIQCVSLRATLSQFVVGDLLKKLCVKQ